MIFFKLLNPNPKHPYFGGKQYRLCNLNCIGISFEYVCNIDNQFKDHINLHNFRQLLVVLSQKYKFQTI